MRISDWSSDVCSSDLLARHGEAWPAIAALIGIAETFWNRDSAWRPMLTEAVFPFYIIHQTVIVVVRYAIVGRGIAPGDDFAILLAAAETGRASRRARGGTAGRYGWWW